MRDFIRGLWNRKEERGLTAGGKNIVERENPGKPE